MNVKKMTGFETSDGQVFKSGPEATRHQAELNERAAIQEWCENHFSNSDNSLAEIVDTLVDYYDELKTEIHKARRDTSIDIEDDTSRPKRRRPI